MTLEPVPDPKPARRPSKKDLERDARAYELWRGGVSFDGIAEQLRKSQLAPARWGADDAAEACRRQQDRIPVVSAVEQRLLEVDRLDRVQVAVWPKAVRGDLAAVKSYLDLSRERMKLRGEARPNTHALRDAFDKAVDSSELIGDVDAALVELGRTTAERIDAAVAAGEGQELTKALYLTPHVMNVLRELLATPAARAAAEKHLPSDDDETEGSVTSMRDAARRRRRSS